MSEEGKQARKAIISNVVEIENENVLRSMILIMGDYKVSENADERAGYLTLILYRLVTIANCKVLRHVYSFIDAICAG